MLQEHVKRIIDLETQSIRLLLGPTKEIIYRANEELLIHIANLLLIERDKAPDDLKQGIKMALDIVLGQLNLLRDSK